MRVVISGGDGFTGRYVRAALEARNIEVVPLVSDLVDSGKVAAEISSLSFDRLIHLAAKAFAGTQDWRGFYEVNTIGSLNLLEAVARYRSGARCILASSAQVYGPHAAGILSESALPEPVTPYAVSKYAMELGVCQWSSELSMVLARPFNYTGVGQSEQYLIPKIVSHFRRRAPAIELGNLDVRRDFGDVRSVAEAYAGLVTADHGEGVVNICSGAVFGLRDILNLSTSMTGHHIQVKVNPAFIRKNDVPVLGGSNARLQQLLPDWRPRKFAETLEWMLNDEKNVVRATH